MPTYVALGPDGSFVFNCETQDYLFSSPEALWKGVDEELDEPMSEDGEGNVDTMRTDGAKPNDYRVFKEV